MQLTHAARSRLLNVSSDEDRIGVVHSIQRLGCASNRMLVGMLTTLLDNDNTTMKLAVLEALASSDVHVTEVLLHVVESAYIRTG